MLDDFFVNLSIQESMPMTAIPDGRRVRKCRFHSTQPSGFAQLIGFRAQGHRKVIEKTVAVGILSGCLRPVLGIVPLGGHKGI